SRTPNPLPFSEKTTRPLVRIFEVVHVAEISAVLVEIQAVADQELVFDLAADVFHGDVDDALVGLVEQSADLNAFWTRALEAIKKELKSAAAVDDLLDDDDVIAADVLGDVLDDGDGA